MQAIKQASNRSVQVVKSKNKQTRKNAGSQPGRQAIGQKGGRRKERSDRNEPDNDDDDYRTLIFYTGQADLAITKNANHNAGGATLLMQPDLFLLLPL